MQGLFLKNQETGREHQPFNAEAEWAKKHLLICVLNYSLDRRIDSPAALVDQMSQGVIAQNQVKPKLHVFQMRLYIVVYAV